MITKWLNHPWFDHPVKSPILLTTIALLGTLVGGSIAHCSRPKTPTTIIDKVVTEELRRDQEQIQQHKQVETQTQRQQRVIEHFDPVTGVRTSRETTVVTQKRQQKVYTTKRQTERVVNKTQTIPVVLPTAVKSSNFGAGTLITTNGAGPCATFKLGSVGPVGVNVVAGWQVIGAPGFRAGVLGTAELAPRIELGVGAVVAPARGIEPAAVLPAAALGIKF